MKSNNKIHIRAKRTDPLDREMQWLTFYVEHESEHAILIDNRVKGSLHTNAFLSKLPNGNLANSAGQEFETQPVVD